MLRYLVVTIALFVASCGPVYETPRPVATPVPTAAPPARGQSAIADYRRVAPRVEAAAESFCRQEYPSRPNNFCDFDVRLIDDPRAPPNAFQTLGRDGRPVIGITTSLLAQTGSADEIAFVLSHEAGHHLAEHLSRQQAQSLAGALIFGTIAAGLGGGDAVADAMDLGAFFGGRVYSQSFELEADVVGAYVATRAGYDPERGALIFTRPALQGGGGLLSTHPPSPQRLAVVRRTTEDIRRQQALGQVPSPTPARR
jgi:predicted Zn-dependent protease